MATEIWSTATAPEAPATGAPVSASQLRETPLFNGLDPDQLECIHGFTRLTAEPGTIFCRENEPVTEFWILVKGRIDGVQALPNGRETLFKSLMDGHSFGEYGFLLNQPSAMTARARTTCEMLRLDAEGFWQMMAACPGAREAVLQNMNARYSKMQNARARQEKMEALGTMAAGLIHELKNPGTAASRAASQLRGHLLRMQELSQRFHHMNFTDQQKICLHDLKDEAFAARKPLTMSSMEQSDAEEALAEWLQDAHVPEAWKLAPTLVAMGFTSQRLECVKAQFDEAGLTDVLQHLESIASSMQLVSTIEESIGRVTALVSAVKSYAYEGKGQCQQIDLNDSLHGTLILLGHKLREKQIEIESELAPSLPMVETTNTGISQIWTNLLDNAIDAVPQGGHISVRTWMENTDSQPKLAVSITDNGPGIVSSDQACIYDPFYTTKPVGVGTGLGLGIVRRVVDEIGGSISLDSHPGKTEFTVRLPQRGC